MELSALHDLRIKQIRPLVPPACLIHDKIHDEKSVEVHRENIKQALRGEGNKIVVIVGPAHLKSKHIAIELAKKLKQAQEKYKEALILVMRAFMLGDNSQGWDGMVRIIALFFSRSHLHFPVPLHL